MSKSKPRVVVRKAFGGGYETVLVIDHQSFSLKQFEPTKKKCQWAARMLRIALKRVTRPL